MSARTPMPEWLAPHKNEWRSAGGLANLISVDGGSFSKWFLGIRDRLRHVDEPINNPRAGGAVRKYLVKQVWAASLAHGVTLIRTLKPDEQEVEKLRARIRDLERRANSAYSSREAIVRLISSVASACEPLSAPGVYFLLADDESVAYVGQSRNVIGRMSGHKEKAFRRVRMIPEGDEAARLRLERHLIELLKPPLNTMLKHNVFVGA